jgi:hypothetical protein
VHNMSAENSVFCMALPCRICLVDNLGSLAGKGLIL